MEKVIVTATNFCPYGQNVLAVTLTYSCTFSHNNSDIPRL